MRTAAVTLIVFALAAGVADAQGRGRNRAKSQGIPPGHMPAAGQCRVWYDGVPPGRQPAPTNCRNAERIAARDRNARVIYGDDRYGYGNDRNGNDRYGNDRYEDGRYENDRTRDRGSNGVTDRVRDILRGNDPNRQPTSNSRYGRAAYDNGFRDGVTKGREDRGDNDSFDPVRHSWYRSGNRGYESRYGSRDDYKLAYRDGFEAGYEQGYGRRTR